MRVTGDKGVHTDMEHRGEKPGDRLDIQEDASGDACQGNVNVDLEEGLDVLDRTLEDLLDFFEDGGYDLGGDNDGIELG